jgi:hypothetical protein
MAAMNKAELKRLHSEHLAGLEQLFAANQDLPKRLHLHKVSALYDEDDDLLEITVDRPQEAVSYSINNRLYIRAAPETNKIVGVELEHFSRALSERSSELRFCWNVLQLAGVSQIAIRAQADGAATDPFQELRELAAALPATSTQ